MSTAARGGSAWPLVDRPTATRRARRGSSGLARTPPITRGQRSPPDRAPRPPAASQMQRGARYVRLHASRTPLPQAGGPRAQERGGRARRPIRRAPARARTAALVVLLLSPPYHASAGRPTPSAAACARQPRPSRVGPPHAASLCYPAHASVDSGENALHPSEPSRGLQVRQSVRRRGMEGRGSAGEQHGLGAWPKGSVAEWA
mmetsp:Transcript_44861/g.124410  ORF Transcript_44861/g.124410 Transcript_44861/m.124410 type:complete len:203 (-) Transcript_44861:557-1165(-)